MHTFAEHLSSSNYIVSDLIQTFRLSVRLSGHPLTGSFIDSLPFAFLTLFLFTDISFSQNAVVRFFS